LDSFGSLQELSDDVYLVSGHKVVSGQLQGVLCVAHCLRTPVKSILIPDTKTYAGIDHYRVAFNALDHKLYSLDWQSKTFLAADWAGCGHPFPKAFAPIMAGQSVPFRTAYLWEGIKVDAGVPGFRMRGMPTFTYAWIRQENGVWVSTRDPRPPLSAPVWRLDRFAAVPTGAQARQTNGQILQGPNQILIAGRQGPVSLLDENGFPMVSGALSHTIPIAADPGLTGIVMLYQWVIPNPDGTVSYSDVFGTSILPAGSSPAQSNSTKGGNTRLQVSTSAWGRAKGKERSDLLSKAKTTMAKALGLSSSYLSKTWVRDYEALRKKMIRQALHKTK